MKTDCETARCTSSKVFSWHIKSKKWEAAMEEVKQLAGYQILGFSMNIKARNRTWGHRAKDGA